MKKSFFRLSVVLVILGLLISACAAPAPGPGAGPAPTGPATGPGTTPQKPATGGPSAATGAISQQVIDAAKKEGEVVFWTHSVDEPDKVFAPFKAKYPFLKVSYWDAPGGSDAVIRMLEEAKIGRHSADLLILSELDYPDLVQNKMLPEFNFPNVQEWRNQPAGQNLYRNIGMSLRAPMYNTDLVKGADIPKGWDSINNAKWRGRAFMSTSGDEVPLLFAYEWREGDNLNWDRAFKFFTEVVDKTRPRSSRGFTAPTQFLVAGDIAIFLVNSLNTGVRNMKMGAPVDIAAVEFVPGSPWAISLVKNAPHPNAALLLMDWLTSEEGNLHYSELQQISSLSPKVYSKQMVGQLFESRGMKISYTPSSLYTLENNRKSGDFWMKLLGAR